MSSGIQNNIYEPLPLLLSVGGSTSSVSTGDSYITLISNDKDEETVNIVTNGTTSLYIDEHERVGISTTKPIRRLNINDRFGNCLRLINNDPFGLSVNYTDFNILEEGTLVINPSSGNIKIPANTGSSGLYIGDTLLRATATQLNALASTNEGVAEPSKVMVLGGNGSISGINSLSSNTIISNNLYGQILTTSQPNITSVGTLTDLNLGTTNNGFLNIYTSENTTYVQSYKENVIGSSSDLFFGNYKQDYTLSNKKIIFKDDGRVGIGTSVPSKQLEISNVDGDCMRLSNNIFYTDFKVTNGGNLLITNNTTYFQALDESNTISRPLTILKKASNQNIDTGIGINYNINDITFGSIDISSESNIDNTGFLKINLINKGVMNNILSLNSYGTLRVQNVTEVSDIRVKENINTANIKNLYNQIMNITIKEYNYKNNPKQKSIGIIAQELSKIIPDAVDIYEHNNIKDFHSIKTKEVLNTLIGAFQHLAHQINKK